MKMIHLKQIWFTSNLFRGYLECFRDAPNTSEDIMSVTIIEDAVYFH